MIDQNMWNHLVVDSYWSALCQTLYDGVEQEDWVTMYNVLREAANKVCIKKQ